MTITLITDCLDDNALGRQTTRLSGLFGNAVSTIGVHSDLEAAGNLIDILDAAEDRPGVCIVNVAPRNGQAKEWPNGTPFVYFRYSKLLILSSLDGRALSLVKKLGLTKGVQVLDIPDACTAMIRDGALDECLAQTIATTQFRSFEFLPRVAHYLTTTDTLLGTTSTLRDITDAPRAIWWIDNFGNAKTTVFTDELELSQGRIKTPWGLFPFYKHLSEVPDGEAALVEGSSGIGNRRFIEFVIQGESAAKHFGLKTEATL